MMALYPYSPIYLHCTVFNLLSTGTSPFTRRMWAVGFSLLPPFLLGKRRRYPFDRRLDEPEACLNSVRKIPQSSNSWPSDYTDWAIAALRYTIDIVDMGENLYKALLRSVKESDAKFNLCPRLKWSLKTERLNLQTALFIWKYIVYIVDEKPRNTLIQVHEVTWLKWLHSWRQWNLYIW